MGMSGRRVGQVASSVMNLLNNLGPTEQLAWGSCMESGENSCTHLEAARLASLVQAPAGAS